MSGLYIVGSGTLHKGLHLKPVIFWVAPKKRAACEAYSCEQHHECSAACLIKKLLLSHHM